MKSLLTEQGLLGEPTPQQGLSRRGLLLGAATGAALLAAKASEAQTGGYLPTASWRSPERRLVRRITNGLTLDEVRSATGLGFNAYLERQLDHSTIDDTACDQWIAQNCATLTMAPRLLYRQADDRVPGELIKATMYRAQNSKRQLFERMVEFWSDHFNIYLYKDDCWALKTVDDRLTIRRYAMTTFRQLLSASSKSAAMMVYLDNASSELGAPNQNYARELMELHSLGVDGGYTQRDVEEVARCFTGWGYDWDGNSATRGQFVFRPELHDEGEKVVLGHRITANGGITDGQKVISILAGKLATARFISRKLLRWLLMYEPSESQISATASVFTASKGDIKTLIRSILTQSNLMAAPAKLKRPLHLATSAFRSLNAEVLDYNRARWWDVAQMGQIPFDWSPPNGYPDSAGFWSGLILPRWNFGFNVLSPWSGDWIRVNWNQVLGSASTVPTILARINALLFAGEINPAENGELSRFLLAGELTENRIRDTFAMAMAMPTYQHY